MTCSGHCPILPLMTKRAHRELGKFAYHLERMLRALCDEDMNYARFRGSRAVDFYLRAVFRAA